MTQNNQPKTSSTQVLLAIVGVIIALVFLPLLLNKNESPQKPTKKPTNWKTEIKIPSEKELKESSRNYGKFRPLSSDNTPSKAETNYQEVVKFSPELGPYDKQGKRKKEIEDLAKNHPKILATIKRINEIDRQLKVIPEREKEIREKQKKLRREQDISYSAERAKQELDLSKELLELTGKKNKLEVEKVILVKEARDELEKK